MLKDASKNVTLNIQILIFIEKLINWWKINKLISQELTQSTYFLTICISKSFHQISQSIESENDWKEWKMKPQENELVSNYQQISLSIN